MLYGTTPAEIASLVRAEIRDALNVWQPPTPTTTTDRLLTRLEVLDRLRITSPTLRNLERSGRLSPCQRIGRKPLWRVADVELYLTGS